MSEMIRLKTAAWTDEPKLDRQNEIREYCRMAKHLCQIVSVRQSPRGRQAAGLTWIYCDVRTAVTQ